MTKHITPLTPASEGPDVVHNFETKDFDIYVDGRYLGSRSNREVAWIEARRVHMKNIESASYETADIEADALGAAHDVAFDTARRVLIDDYGVPAELVYELLGAIADTAEAQEHHLVWAAVVRVASSVD